MITPFLIDRIDIISRSVDVNGVPTDSSETGISARVEDYNQMLRDTDGNEVVGSMLIMLEPDTDIEYEDFIKIKKKNGVSYDLPDKEWAIKKIENVAGFSASHKEVYI